MTRKRTDRERMGGVSRSFGGSSFTNQPPGLHVTVGSCKPRAVRTGLRPDRSDVARFLVSNPVRTCSVGVNRSTCSSCRRNLRTEPHTHRTTSPTGYRIDRRPGCRSPPLPGYTTPNCSSMLRPRVCTSMLCIPCTFAQGLTELSLPGEGSPTPTMRREAQYMREQRRHDRSCKALMSYARRSPPSEWSNRVTRTQSSTRRRSDSYGSVS